MSELLFFGLGILVAALFVGVVNFISNAMTARDLSKYPPGPWYHSHRFDCWSVDGENRMRYRACRCGVRLGEQCDHQWVQNDFVFRADCRLCDAQKLTQT